MQLSIGTDNLRANPLAEMAITGGSYKVNASVIVEGCPQLVGKFQDTANLVDLSVLLDLPELISVARYVWSTGTGYEVFWTTQTDVEDYNAAMAVCGHHQLLQYERWGSSESGYDQYRALFWEV